MKEFGIIDIVHRGVIDLESTQLLAELILENVRADVPTSICELPWPELAKVVEASLSSLYEEERENNWDHSWEAGCDSSRLYWNGQFTAGRFINVTYKGDDKFEAAICLGERDDRPLRESTLLGGLSNAIDALDMHEEINEANLVNLLRKYKHDQEKDRAYIISLRKEILELENRLPKPVKKAPAKKRGA